MGNHPSPGLSPGGPFRPCGRPGTRRAASTSLLGLAPGGVCLAGASPRRRCALTAPFHPCRRRGHVRPRRLGGVFLWHFPAGFPGSRYATTPPFGVRTFLEQPAVSPAARGCLASLKGRRARGWSPPAGRARAGRMALSPCCPGRAIWQSRSWRRSSFRRASTGRPTPATAGTRAAWWPGARGRARRGDAEGAAAARSAAGGRARRRAACGCGRRDGGRRGPARGG